jgi:hypothetical protein
MAEISLTNSLVLLILIMLPLGITLFPPLIESLRDEFPDQVKQGNPLFMLFSPYLDRKGIAEEKTPREILNNSVRTGTQGIADRIAGPVLSVINRLQSAIARSLVAIREGIQKSLSVPMRALFTMATSMSKALNSILESVLGSVQGLFNQIQYIIQELSGMAIVALNLQITSLNTLYASIGFFMMLLKVLGGIVIALGIPMMFSIFLIPFAITLITIGSIMVNISLTSEGVIPKDRR